MWRHLHQRLSHGVLLLPVYHVLDHIWADVQIVGLTWDSKEDVVRRGHLRKRIGVISVISLLLFSHGSISRFYRVIKIII